MKEVKLKIGRKSYMKSEPVIHDVIRWHDQMEGQKVKLDMNQDALNFMVGAVSHYLGISTAEITKSNIKANKIAGVYRCIHESINKCLVDGGYNMDVQSGMDTLHKVHIGIMHMAKELLFEKGVLPDDFFKQTLRNFIKVVTFENDDSEVIMSASQADETGF